MAALMAPLQQPLSSLAIGVDAIGVDAIGLPTVTSQIHSATAVETHSLLLQEVALKTLGETGTAGAPTDLSPDVDDSMPRELAIFGQRGQKVADLPSRTGPSRESSNLSIGNHPSLGHASEQSVHPAVKRTHCRPQGMAPGS